MFLTSLWKEKKDPRWNKKEKKKKNNNNRKPQWATFDRKQSIFSQLSILLESHFQISQESQIYVPWKQREAFRHVYNIFGASLISSLPFMLQSPLDSPGHDDPTTSDEGYQLGDGSQKESVKPQFS